MVGGLGGNAIGNLGSAGNILPNALSAPIISGVQSDPDQVFPDNFPVEDGEWESGP
jgi:hypothetical protein